MTKSIDGGLCAGNSVIKSTTRCPLLPKDSAVATNPPPGCKFQTRYRYAIDICRKDEPKLSHLGFEHDVACHRWQEIADESEVSGADPA